MNENKYTEHLSEYEISLVVDAMQSDQLEELDQKISTHLESCTTCKIQAMELSELMVAMDDAGISEDPQIKTLKTPEKKASNWKVWAMVASFALLIASSLFYWWNSNKYETQIANLETELAESAEQVVAHKNDSLNALIQEMEVDFQEQIETYIDSVNQARAELKENQDLLASLFEPNPLLEEEMNLNLRSNSIRVTSPEQNEYASNEKVPFIWDDASATQLSLVLYNNKGLAILQVENITNGYELLTEQLTPGVYYWQLFQENEMVGMDKFDLR